MTDEFYRTFKASGNLSTQYSLVKMENDEEVGNAGANGKAFGILQNTPSDGESAVVKVAGISKFEAGEAVAVGKYVTSTASGLGEVADAAGEHCIGVAIKSTSASGGIGKVVIAPFTAHASDA